MTPAVLPPITAPVSIENTPGGAIAGIPAVSRVWNTIAKEFTGDMKHNDVFKTPPPPMQGKKHWSMLISLWKQNIYQNVGQACVSV